MSEAFFFDPELQEGSTNFEPVPPDDYVAEVVETEITQPKSGDGQMAKLTWKVCEGEYKGRLIWQRLCYLHSNAQTQDIARRMLKDICVAFGIHEQITDLEILKFKPARITVGIEKGSGQYGDQNCIKRVKPLTDSDGEAQEAKRSVAATKPASKQPTPPPKPTGNGPGAAPWKR